MLNVVVFSSGRGSNFAALIAAQQHGGLSIRLRALISDKAKAPALEIAARAGIPSIALLPRDYADRASFDRAVFAQAAEFDPDLIVLAGYMRVIDAAVIAQWRGKVINIHPSLLPKYPGLYTHQRALDAGDTAHGASVHFVSAELDGGPVIARVELPIHVGDTSDALAARLLPLEHRLLVASVDMFVRGRIALDAHGVELDGRQLTAPLHMVEDGTLANA